METNEDEDNIVLNDVDSAQITGKKRLSLNQKIIIFSSVGAVILILLIVIIVLIASNSKNEIEESTIDLPKKGAIKCTYNIQDVSSSTQLLGNDYEIGNSLIDLIINGKRIKYLKSYKFSSPGDHDIEINIYNEVISMEKMFLNIEGLTKVELIPSENQIVKVNSMSSTFEGCVNLESFVNKGFNTDEVTSMHKRFFRTSLSDIKYDQFLSTKNVMDMSYAFSYTKIDTFNFEILIQVKLQICRIYLKDVKIY